MENGAAQVYFHCGHGNVERGWTVIDGRVDVAGTLKEYGGIGPGPDYPARYVAIVSGSKMRLTIAGGGARRTYFLTRGQRGRIDPCTRP